MSNYIPNNPIDVIIYPYPRHIKHISKIGLFVYRMGQFRDILKTAPMLVVLICTGKGYMVTFPPIPWLTDMEQSVLVDEIVSHRNPE